MKPNPKQNVAFVLCLLAVALTSKGQYYPGGLGNGSLILWLDANNSGSVTINGANQVTGWADGSGHGFNFSQATLANSPVYGATASPTARPALTFTSTSSQYLSIASLPAWSFTAGVSVFTQVSYNATQTAWGWQRLFDFGNGQANNNFMMGRNGATANNYYEGWNGGSGDETWTNSNPIVNGAENLFEAIQTGSAPGSVTSVTHYVAGALQASSGQAGSNTHVPATIARTSNFIGRSNWAADDYFSGTMSEILLYNTVVNTTQRVILENYLSAKWNQAVSVTKYTPPTATTYTTNLVGIGYTSAADNFTTDVVAATDGLGFSSGTTAADFLSAAGYIMAAHNAQSNTVITNATVPGIISGSAMTKWNRSWDVQLTGGTATGAVTLNFNIANYNGGSFNPANTFALLYNATDGTFATGANKLVPTLSTTATAGTVAFKVTASNLANGYYTILYSTSPIVLPVTLTGFTAYRRGTSTLLQWTTAAQKDFGNFTIERSGDGGSFSAIGIVPADTNRTNTAPYSFIDNNPLPGMNAYRLAMVDRDGDTTWSTVRMVNFGPGSTGPLFSVYPNPAVDRLHLEFPNAAGKFTIRLLNSRGQLLQTINAIAPTTLDIPTRGLAKGIYFLVVDGDQRSDVRTIIKE